MAFVPRLQLSRVLGLALRSRGAVVRPTTPSLATRLRCLSVASYPTWNASCRVENKSVSKWTVRPLPLLLSRGFAAEGLTVEELKERTVNVLKLFDKVNPEKARCTHRLHTHTHTYIHTVHCRHVSDMYKHTYVRTHTRTL